MIGKAISIRNKPACATEPLGALQPGESADECFVSNCHKGKLTEMIVSIVAGMKSRRSKLIRWTVTSAGLHKDIDVSARLDS